MDRPRPPTKLPKTEKEKEAVVVQEDGDEEDEAAAGVDTKRRLAAKRGSGSCGVTRCQADKCTADLTEEKRYNCRHKVCEVHSKAAAVVVAGRRQRFCQQCSRFHELSEFDEYKRSCRRRLAGHNERRRKSSSETAEGNQGLSRCRAANQEGKTQMTAATLSLAIPRSSISTSISLEP
ncbi:squamosa promoter-binding protein 1-like [Zingiber officinale]|uniref:SBP-type domain-containing protein n=1 Tax=Zingiber officinale TaxID=94328 RepID=A0A8J5LNF9_ZINOF|nr:squamosa promoter-binding protein 1-like [Zingiber officinale]KAG6521998.1 hypothetical protein ZIOFF_019132 [Zingiber officinale]